jgi:hypothetical protein
VTASSTPAGVLVLGWVIRRFPHRSICSSTRDPSSVKARMHCELGCVASAWVITSEQGKRGGRFLALKHTVDHAVAACPCVKKVRTCAGRAQPSRVAARRDDMLSVLFVQVFVFARGEADPSVHVHYHGTSPCIRT